MMPPLIVCLLSIQLYDLMTMAFKYQVSLSLRPKDIMLVTLNHMDSIRKFTEGSKSLGQQVENVFNLMIKVRTVNLALIVDLSLL